MVAGTGGVTVDTSSTTRTVNVPAYTAGSGGVTVGTTGLSRAINVPVYTAGTGGVTVGTSGLTRTINIPTPVTSVTPGTNITVSGPTATPTIALASPLVLSAPLSLSSAVPSSTTDLGYSVNVTTVGATALASGTQVTLGSTTIALPGVYLVSANVVINMNAGTVPSSIQVTHLATPNATAATANIYNVVPYYTTVAFAVFSQIALVLSGVVNVVSPGSCVFSLRANVFYGAGGVSTVASPSYTITRIG